MMKSAIVSIVALLALAAGAPQDNPKADKEKEKTPERSMVDRYFAAFNRHDLDGLMELYATDALMEDPSFAKPVRGRAAIRDHIQKLFGNVPDIKDEVRSVVHQPGKAAVEFVSTGTPRGAPGGFSMRIACFFDIADGKIVRDSTYFDRSK